MKRSVGLVFGFLALLGVALPASFAGADEQTFTPYPLVAEHTFVPPGFDDNDNSQIVIAGNLPDTCHRMGPTKVIVEKGSRKIIVRQTAYRHTDQICLEVLVPYVKSLDVGTLLNGKYRVYFDRGRNERPVLTAVFGVAKSATSSADEFLYAPVTDLVVQQSNKDGSTPATLDLYLAGKFRMDCMRLAEVKVLKRAKGIVEVLPIMEIREPGNGRKCGVGHYPFSARMQVSLPWNDHTLVHVRLPDGQSMNRVVELY